MDPGVNYIALELILSAILMLLALIFENHIDGKKKRGPWG